jgi:glycosyltransferase involved in cell wall biosynthesis
MTEHLVLIFAYHFPPENAIGGARPFRFTKYLSRMGYKCRVFTAAAQTGRNDPNTECVPDPFITHSRRGVGSQVERAVRKFFLPGELGTQWSFHASRAARRYLRTQRSTSVTIFSTFPPLGSHLAAWQLARSESLRWIADFRDPMHYERDDGTINFFQRWIYQWLEQTVVRRADAVIANTDAAMVRLLRRFPALGEKVHLIWNGFDPEERVLPLPVSSGDRRVLSHIGELYGGRNVAPLLESLARLIAQGRLPVGSVCARLIGPAEARALPNAEFLGRARAEGWLELITEQIPKREALQIARSSSGLLLLQLRSSVHVPAKIFEYLQIGRPILAFIQPNSPAERILDQSGVPYRCVYPGSTPETVDETVAEFLTLPATVVAANSWFEEQFNSENQTRMLDAIIRSLYGGPWRGTNP